MSVSSPVAMASSPIRSSPLGPNRVRNLPPPSHTHPSSFSSPSHSHSHFGSRNLNFRAGHSNRSHGPPHSRKFPASSPSTRRSSRPDSGSNRSDLCSFSPSPILSRSTSTSSLIAGGFFNTAPDFHSGENGLGFTSVTQNLWRDKFRARCADRVSADKKKALGRKRSNVGSSEASDADGMTLDAEEDDEEDGEDEFEQEIFRRIMRSQEARRQKEFTRSSTSIGIPLEALLEDEVRGGWKENIQEMEGMEEEIEMEEEVDEFDPEYLEYLLDQGCATSSDILDSAKARSMPSQISIDPPPCPQCPPTDAQTESRPGSSMAILKIKRVIVQ
ncbi:hypothetical protein [Phaffia rhodozyma]|uniref:Uncharacterized protein n=1 Tax=Phaffia rhodozyma TaxID=264483 RepID=A0A0F7SSS2_PHARH|nr:hypothetical protein [Phaffia rhodozyma]